MAEKTIRIGTRDSELALWQAHTVEKKLNDLGYKTSIVAVKSPKVAVKPREPFSAFSSFNLLIPKALVTGLLFGESKISEAPLEEKLVKRKL